MLLSSGYEDKQVNGYDGAYPPACVLPRL